MSKIEFIFNPISEPNDTFPENPRDITPPMSFDYNYATEKLGEKSLVQV